MQLSQNTVSKKVLAYARIPAEACQKHRIPTRKGLFGKPYCQICSEEAQGKDSLNLFVDWCRELLSDCLSGSSLKPLPVLRRDGIETVTVDFLGVTLDGGRGWYARYLEREWAVELLGGGAEAPLSFAYKLSIPQRRARIMLDTFLANLWVLHKQLERTGERAARLTVRLPLRKISKKAFEEFQRIQREPARVEEVLRSEEFLCKHTLVYSGTRFRYYVVALSIGRESFFVRV